MNTRTSIQSRQRDGSGLLVTIVMTAIALATLAGTLAWSVSTTRLNERANQFNQSVAAAEANTEAVIGHISRDFRENGAKYVRDNTNIYAQTVLTNARWEGWQFNDGQGNSARTFVDIGGFTNFVELDSAYSNLQAFVSKVRVVTNARLTNSLQDVTAAVGQSFQLANIPIFQFAMFSSGDMEIENGQPLRVTGRVHSNRNIYVAPLDSTSGADLTFQSDVTAVGSIIFGRHPNDLRAPPTGTVAYNGLKEPHRPALTMPIGTNTSESAIREIIQPPPSGEDPNSPIGRQRYYNKVDLIITVTGNSTTNLVVATNGIPFGNNRGVTNLHLRRFAYVSNSFTDARESKIVRPLDINIGAFSDWARTNTDFFGNRIPSSIYIDDRRTMSSGHLNGVRVFNGRVLPTNGLTIATSRPLYVRGHYNQPTDGHLGTTNTSTTKPASFAADAITILSGNWSDPLSDDPIALRIPIFTTVNAAFLMGAVETTAGGTEGYYSGGMENFPRFLEDWGPLIPFTYNGSMVKMFPSQYATNRWGRDTAIGVYDVPRRDWAFDTNFKDPTKLPPLTPNVSRVLRSQWANLAPNQTVIAPSNL